MENKKILRQCKSLAEKECANYCNRMCLSEDRPCHVINSRYTNIRDGAIDCDWFMETVLPGSDELNVLIRHDLLNEMDRSVSDVRKCERCVETYVPSSPRQKYCVPCGKDVRKQKSKEKQRKHNERLREKRCIIE